jgi:CheY-like chemotaxis protein
MTTILIVDDSKFSRGRVAAALAPLGHQLVEAENGARALDRIRRQLPDLLITDLLMPEVDGFGLLTTLQHEGLQVPTIVISADIQATSRARAVELGAIDFINKPFKPCELLQLAARALAVAAEELQSCR